MRQTLYTENKRERQRKMTKRVLVIIPAYNEEKSIGQVVKGLLNKSTEDMQVDYIVINDCSTDTTVSVLKEDRISHVTLPINMGIGGAVQTGYRYALEGNYDIAVQMDGDGQHDEKYLYDICKPIIEDSADAVIGSRFINKEGFQSSITRRLGISILSSWLRVLCKLKIKDVTSGYRAVNRKLIELYAKEYPADYPEPQALVAAAMMGVRVCEVPVVMKAREYGTSSIDLRRSVYYMFKVAIDMFIRRIEGVK